MGQTRLTTKSALPPQWDDAEFDDTHRNPSTSNGLGDYDGKLADLYAEQERVLEHFFDTVGRTPLIQALDTQPDDSKWGKLQSALLDPSWRNIRFARICKKLKIDPKDLTEFWRTTHIQEGIIRQFAKLPSVMEHQADKALPRIVYCDKCDGLGQVLAGYIEDSEGNKTPQTRPCPKCKGSCEIQQDGDKDAAVLLYKSAGLIDKPAPAMAVQVNFGDRPEDTSALIGKLISGGQ